MSDNAAVKWAIDYLATPLKYSVESYKEIAYTAYSAVYQIKTTIGTVYLKQVPEAFFVEPTLLQIIEKRGCGHIPQVIATNPELYCFIMSSCGDISLCHLFEGKADIGLLKQGISNYTNIQRSMENNIEQLLALGIPDWRLDKLPSLYEKLIQKDKLLITDGLAKEELERLRQLYPVCIELCEKLAEYKLPETINHCDFHENNMLYDRVSSTVNIIDWGEVVVSHPLLSLSGCLWNISHFNNMNPLDSMYHKLQSACIEVWLSMHKEDTLITALQLANQLNGLFAALAYDWLYTATSTQVRKVQQEHAGSIAGCLKSFLCLF